MMTRRQFDTYHACATEHDWVHTDGPDNLYFYTLAHPMRTVEIVWEESRCYLLIAEGNKDAVRQPETDLDALLTWQEIATQDLVGDLDLEFLLL